MQQSVPRSNWRAPVRPHTLIALVAATLLSGCKDENKVAAQAFASTAERAWQATEQQFRSAAGSPKQMQFRGVRVYSQAMPQHLAVCGLLDPFADDPRIFVPFVSIVTVAANGAAGQYQFEQHVGTTPADASRVYEMLIDYCYDKGGPSAGPNPGVMPMAPLPDAIPDPASKTTAAAPAPQADASAAGLRIPASQQVSVQTPGQPIDQIAASGSVTMRQSANVHTDPHGAVVRVAQAGTVMRVFAQTKDGWYQVGDAAPWGWVYGSMLDRH
jgi:hypothetical protein